MSVETTLAELVAIDSTSSRSNVEIIRFLAERVEGLGLCARLFPYTDERTAKVQVSGCRGETETLEKMRARIDYDLRYLRNWSVGLDLAIILKTMVIVLRDRNAY